MHHHAHKEISDCDAGTSSEGGANTGAASDRGAASSEGASTNASTIATRHNDDAATIKTTRADANANRWASKTDTRSKSGGISSNDGGDGSSTGGDNGGDNG